MGFNIINTLCVLNEKQNSVQSSLNFIIQFKDQRCMSTVFKSCTCYHMKYPCIDGYGIKSCMEIHLCVFPTGNQIYTTKSPYLVNWITKNQKKKVSNILRIWDKQTLYVSVLKFNSIRTRSSHFKSHNHFSRKRQLKKIKIKSPCHKISIEFLRCPNVLSTVFPDEVSSLPSTW